MHWILTVSDTFMLDNIIARSRLMMAPPFRLNGTSAYLNRVERLSTGHTIDLGISQSTSGLVLQTDARLNSRETEEISQKTWRMLRIGENLHAFLVRARKTPELATGTRNGIVQLRGATLFEDLIKAAILICKGESHYNQPATWLVDYFGDPLPNNPTLHAFPTASQLAEEPRTQINMLGPKLAHYITQVITAFDNQDAHLVSLFNMHINVNDFESALRHILDAPTEAVGTAMAYLGRYDYIPIDTRAQQRVGTYLGEATPATPTAVRALFEPWQPWGGLAYSLWDWASKAIPMSLDSAPMSLDSAPISRPNEVQIVWSV